jgi:hypothetical protein
MTFFVMWTLPYAITKTLVRGGVLDESFQYWAVEDTFLDANAPNRNFGRDLMLLGGPDKTILIRFGDLERAIGRDKKIRSAKLILRIEDGQTARLRAVCKVLVPWGEGPGATGVFFSNPLTEERKIESKNSSGLGLGSLIGFRRSPEGKEVEEKPPFGAATWKVNQYWDPPFSWQKPGALGDSDAVILPEVSCTQEGREVTVSGLENAIQSMVDCWYENYGFALLFNEKIHFASSDAPNGRPSLIIEYEEKQDKPEAHLSVTHIQSSWSRVDAWPSPREAITYTAYVKNTGKVSCQVLQGQWSYRGQVVKEVGIPFQLAPGAVAKFDFSLPFERNTSDARGGMIRFVVKAEASDGVSLWDALEVSQSAYPIGICMSESVFQAFDKAAKASGYRGVEDWAQYVFRFWNETLLPQSRFSFAPEGCLHRVRLQGIEITGGESTEGVVAGAMSVWHVGKDGSSLDPEALARRYVVSKAGLRQTLRDIHLAMGFPDLYQVGSGNASSEDKSSKGKLSEGKGGGYPVDKHPGLMGWGDTRDERSLPTLMSIQYEGWPDPLWEAFPLYPTDLYSATEVALLQTQLGQGPLRDGLAKLLPELCFVKVLSAGGTPIPKAQLTLYRTRNGRPEDMPVASFCADAQGMVHLVPGNSHKKEGLQSFSGLVSSDSDGLFLVRATLGETSQSAWLKTWYFADSFARGNTRVAVVPLRFNMPAYAIDERMNLAKNKIVTDSVKSLPARLVALVTENNKRVVATCRKKGDWIEIDLGRDRAIGRVSFDFKGDQFWPKFDIQLYGTGQKPSEAIVWTSERNGQWAVQNRSQQVSGDPEKRTLHYFGSSAFGRYVRILLTEDAPEVGLLNVRIYPVKAQNLPVSVLSR